MVLVSPDPSRDLSDDSAIKNISDKLQQVLGHFQGTCRREYTEN